MELTEEQKAVVESEAPRLAVVAVPGSGKTMTLVRRVAHVAERVTNPKSIRVVTFTVAAAAEFRERLTDLGVDVNALDYVGTVHGLALRIIRCHRGGEWSVISRELGDHMIEEIIDGGGHKTTVGQVLKALGTLRERTATEIVATLYGLKLEELKALEVDTLIPVAERLLSESTLTFAGGHVRRRRMLFVDEFQDTTEGDRRFFEQLVAGPGDEITVVGDPDQSVYGFRGASPRAFTAFCDEADEVLRLSTSFRLRPKIATAANCLMSSGLISWQSLDDIAASDFVGEIQVHRFPDPASELTGLRPILADLVTEFELKDIAVVCRYNRQVQAVATVLEAYGFRVKSHEPVCPKIKKALAFAKAVSAQNSALAAAEWKCAGGQDLPNVPDVNDVDGLYVAMTAEAKIDRRAAMWFARIHRAADNVDQAIVDAAIDIAIESDQRSSSDDSEITVSTMHGVKGLEFKLVVMLGCDQMTMPGPDPGDDRVAEERRLFYVAMTRAIDKLLMTYSETRSRHYVDQLEVTIPSQFLAESGLRAV